MTTKTKTTVTKSNDVAMLEEAALRERLDTLAQKHARAVAEQDETEEENIKLIKALRDIRKVFNEADNSISFREVNSQVMDIVNRHIK